MNLLEKMEKIEYPSVRNLEWYYHSFYFEEEKFRDMLIEGIKCRKLLSLESGGNNGLYYISLTKDLGIAEDAFDSFNRSSNNFIISGISPIRCSTLMFPLYHFLARTKIPLRSSGWKEEFQEYLKIMPENLVGLQCPLYNWVVEAIDERYIGDFTNNFINLKMIIQILREYGHTMPIYDYSRRLGENVHLIDTDTYLEECDGIVEEVKRLTKKRTEKSASNFIKFVV